MSLLEAEESVRTEHGVKHRGHWLLKASLFGLLGWGFLPVFGIGIYKNTSGDRSFDLWYLLVFMIIALILMHELIAPLPPKEQTE
jgi:hypothetical protein